MSGKRPFSKLTKRNTAAASPSISFRFSQLDEELEDVSYDQKHEQSSSDKSLSLESKQAISFTEKTSFKDDTVEKVHNEVSSVVNKGANQENVNAQNDYEVNGLVGAPEDREQSKTAKYAVAIKEQTVVKDTVKDYFSRLGRRAASLDSDSTSADSEVWPFLKDLKGKITRNLEDRINKDSLTGITEGEMPESQSYPELKSNCDSSQNAPIPVYNPLTRGAAQSDNVDGKEHISPSIEATESLEERAFLASEKDSSGSQQKTSSTHLLSKSRYKQPAKKVVVMQSNLKMSLSSLMSSRTFSYEDVKSNTVPNEESKKTVITGDSESEKRPVPATVTEERKFKFSDLFFHILTFIPLKSLSESSWRTTISSIFLVLLACAIMPNSSVIWSFLIGCVCAGWFVYWLMRPLPAKEAFRMPDYEILPQLKIDRSEISSERIYKGWMNELPFEYNPDTYHVNCTNSVYIRLDGSYLRVSHPKTNIPKRAMFNEPRHELAFVHQRHYDITRASVDLLPEGLHKKRLWSKKYPICIRMPDPRASDAKEPIDAVPCSTFKAQSSKSLSPVKKYEPRVNEKGEIVIYLFARTDREKDDWYNRFLQSSQLKKISKSCSPLSTPNITSLESQSLENKRAVSVDLGSLQLSTSLGNIRSLDDQDLEDDAFTEVKFDKQSKFEYYMSQLLSTVHSGDKHSKRGTYVKGKSDVLDAKSSKSLGQGQPAQNLLWLNALIGRMFFDFLMEDVWAAAVSERIQRKLSKIKLPNFIEELKVTDINLGSALPKIHRTSSPVVDDRGLWVDIDVSYNGSFQMTLETKLNLLRLKRTGEESYSFASQYQERERELVDMPVGSLPHISDSDEEDSAESSSDDDVPLPDIGVGKAVEESGPLVAGSGSAGKKLIRLVDRIAQSNYFQTAARNKYIKRAMEEVSNTPLVLTVEIHWLIGTLALNIPPMPTDRLWYGFRKNPKLSIVARPKLGCRAVTLTQITDWIEKKLVLEFQKVLVMPNMDDLIIPIMHPNSETTKT